MSVSTKCISLLLLVITLFSCDTRDPAEIKNLHTQAIAIPELNHVSALDKSKSYINGIRICDQTLYPCDKDERQYNEILEELEADRRLYHSLLSRMKKLGFTSYYRHDDYTLWVDGGAMGTITGILVTNENTSNPIESFRLNNKYYIDVGAQLHEGIYYFSGG